jgi:hypothetical protein
MVALTNVSDGMPPLVAESFRAEPQDGLEIIKFSLNTRRKIVR